MAATDLLHENRPGNQLTQGFVRCGDAEAALATSAHVAEGEVETAFVEHAYIEPEAGSAWMEGEVLVIRACTQAPVMDRDDMAALLALPSEQVRIIPSAVGGGFGSKLDLSLQPFLGLVALKTGRPCRMVYSRSESMASTTKRHPARIRARIGCDGGWADHGDGIRRRLQHRGLFQLGTDGGQPGAGSCDRPLPHPQCAGAGAGHSYAWAGGGGLSRLLVCRRRR